MIAPRSFVTLLFVLLSLTSATHAQEQLRPAADVEQQQERSLAWVFGRGFLGNVLCGIFGSCPDSEDEDDEDRPTPILDLVTDIFNTSDGSTPIADALNKTQDSEQPLKDFLGELLDQPGSDQPVRDFMTEAFNRSDSPLLDFLADLYDTVTGKTPIRDFVRDLINGSDTPLQDAIQDWLGDEVFADLNCTTPAAPGCAYNLEGDEGVWVCRTLYHPFEQGRMTNKTLCVIPAFTLKNNDKCGSCDGTYPTQCSCTCDVDGMGDGVILKLKDTDEQQCVNKKWALNALTRFAVECATC